MGISRLRPLLLTAAMVVCWGLPAAAQAAPPEPPTPTGTSPVSPASDTSPLILGTAENNATVRLYTNATCTSAVAASGREPEFASPGLAVTVAPGSSTTFWATASRGNSSNTSSCSTASVTYVTDATPPAPPTIDGRPASPGNDLSPVWAFSGAGADAFECRLERGSITVADWARCTAPHAYDLTVGPDATYRFEVRALDVAGNRSTSTSDDYQLDTDPPPAPSLDAVPASPARDSTPTFAFSSSEPGASLACRLERGATVVQDWGACASPRTLDLSGQPDGTYTLRVRAVDSVGNAGPDATAAYDFDATGPAAPTIASPGPLGNDATPTWGFSSESGASAECRLTAAGGTIADWAPCTTSWTADLTSRPDGAYTFAVRATDTAGNLGAVGQDTYLLDRMPPAAPSLGNGPGMGGSDATPAWDFTGEPGAVFECRLTRAGATISDWGACTSPDGYDVGAEADGTYTFSVRSTDAAGNAGPAASADYLLDRTAPGAPAFLTTPGPTGSDSTPAWTFSGEPGATAECQVARGASVLVAYAPCTSPAAIDLSTYGDNTYTLRVRLVDGAGNAGPAIADDYALDTSAAATPVITGRPGPALNDTTPTWSFTGEPGVTFACKLTRGAAVVVDFGACSSAKTFDLSSEPDGTYTFQVVAVDAAGNSSAAAVDVYALDATSPGAPLISATPGATGNDPALSWSFAGEAGATLECRLSEGATEVSAWSSCTSPRAYDVSARPDGTFTFMVRATDAAGNTGPASSHDHLLDRSAPAAPVFGAGPGAAGSDRTPAWAFTGEAGASLRCRVQQGAAVVEDWGACTSPRTVDLAGAPDGLYTLLVHAVDAAGNAGADASATYELDTAAPVAPALTASPPATGSARNPSWGFAGEAGASFECRLTRAGATVAGWAPCTTPRAYDLAGEPDGTYVFAVRATDSAQNTGPATTGAYVLDSATPAAPSLGPVPGADGNDTTPAWGFTGEPGATFECRLERGATTVSGWAPCSNPRGYDLAAQPDGPYRFAVRQRDAAGNLGPAALDDYALDTVAPAAPSIASAPSSPGTEANPSWAFSGETGTTLQCRLERDGGGPVSDWSACASARAYDLAGEPDGAFTFRVRARDAAGNTGTEATAAYVLDTTRPVTPAFRTTPGATGRSATPVWSFAGEAGTSFECRLTRGATIVSDWTACADPRGYDLGGRPDGTYVFAVRSTDTAGNASLAARDAYALDTTRPAVPVLTGGPGALGASRTPAWTFTGEPGASFSCRLESAGSVVRDWLPCASPAGTDLTGRPDGPYTLRVRATDGAGNTGNALAIDYRLDTTPAAAPVLSGGPGPRGRDLSPAWAISAEAGTTLSCRLSRDGAVVADWAPCTDPARLDLHGAPDGTYTIAVRATDAAGNTGAAATELYELDATAPASPVIVDGPPASGILRQATWSFTGDAGASFSCRLTRDGTVVSDWEPCASPRSYDLTLEPAGRFTFSVRATDAVGNTTPAATAAYALEALGGAPGDGEPPVGPGDPPPVPSPTPGVETPGDAQQAPANDTDAEAVPAAGGDRTGGAGAGRSDDRAGGARRTTMGDWLKGVARPRGEGPRATLVRPGDQGLSLVRGIGKVATAVVRNADKAAFPLLLLLLVLIFLALQNRIDRRDPKLALAPLSADEELDFSPPLRA